MKLLFEAWENGTPELGGTYMLAEAECESDRFSDIFKGHPAWKTLIVFGGTTGTYRLNLPEKT